VVFSWQCCSSKLVLVQKQSASRDGINASAWMMLCIYASSHLQFAITVCCTVLVMWTLLRFSMQLDWWVQRNEARFTFDCFISMLTYAQASVSFLFSGSQLAYGNRLSFTLACTHAVKPTVWLDSLYERSLDEQ
jgi:hypothetical protein